MIDNSTNEASVYVSDILKDSNIPGGAIRDIAMGILQISKELGLSYKVKAIVLDTNIILKDLGYAYKHKKATSLYTEASFEFVKLLATPSVMEEVVEHIPKYAERMKTKPEDLYNFWEVYKKSITIIKPEKQNSESIQKLKKRDPDDVATAELIENILPDLALSDDKDLCDHAQSGDWLSLVRSLSRSIERDAVHIVLTGGTNAIIISTAPALEGLINIFVSLVKKIPKRLLFILCICLAALITDRRSRSWIASKIRNIYNPKHDYLKDVKKFLFEQILFIGTVYKDGYEADAILKSISKLDTIPSTLKVYIIRILVRSSVPLSVPEIFDKAKELGYQPRGESSQKYLRRILREDIMFIEDKNGKWKLTCEEII